MSRRKYNSYLEPSPDKTVPRTTRWRINNPTAVPNQPHQEAEIHNNLIQPEVRHLLPDLPDNGNEFDDLGADSNVESNAASSSHSENETGSDTEASDTSSENDSSTNLHFTTGQQNTTRTVEAREFLSDNDSSGTLSEVNSLSALDLITDHASRSNQHYDETLSGLESSCGKPNGNNYSSNLDFITGQHETTATDEEQEALSDHDFLPASEENSLSELDLITANANITNQHNDETLSGSESSITASDSSSAGNSLSALDLIAEHYETETNQQSEPSLADNDLSDIHEDANNINVDTADDQFPFPQDNDSENGNEFIQNLLILDAADENQEEGPAAVEDPFKGLKEKLRGRLSNIISSQPRLSVGEFLLNALTLVTHFRMNMSEFEGVMKLVNTMFPDKVLPDTRYLLDQLFKSVSGTHYHFVCSDCLDYIGEFDHSVTVEVNCKNPSCLKVNRISNLNEASFFVMFDLPSQIEILLSKDNNFEALKNPFDLINNSQPLVMKDLYDGSMYQRFITSISPNTNDVRHISCCFGVDGAALYTSSKCQIWPLFASVLELPPKIRDHNLLLGGLWFSKCHAKQDVFLIPFVEHFRALSTQGFKINVKGEEVHMKAHLLCCCADAPARAAVQGIQQHGGGFCCHWCLDPSEHKKFGTLNYVPEKRTQEEIIADGSAAMVLDGKDKSVNGVRSLSPLLSLKTFDIVDGMILEYFHATAHGIAKTLLGSWLGDDGSTPLFYIGTPVILEKLDKFMLSIRLPVEARRRTRKITESAHWKGREFENFILYTSVPLLTGTLRPRYLNNWICFVQGMHYVLQEETIDDRLDKAGNLLHQFRSGVEELYPDRHLTYNLHIVTSHLAENCKRWGPAWCINGYSYEGGNKILKGQIHANLGVASQVCRAQSHFRSLDILETHVATPFSMKFKNDLQKKIVNRCIYINEDKYFEMPKQFKATREETYLCHQNGIDPNDFALVPKLIHNSCVFTTKSKREEFDNSAALLKNGDIVLIDKIIVSEELSEGFLIVQKMITVPSYVLPGIPAEEIAIRTVSYTHAERKLVSPNDLKTVCAHFLLPHGEFVVKVPNTHNTT